MPPRPGEDVEHVLTEEECREIDRAEEEWEELREKRLRSDWAPFHPFASERRELLRPISDLHRQVAARYLRARKDFNLDTRAGKEAAYNYAVMLLAEIWPKEGVPLAELAAARERATAEPMRRREIALQLWLEEPTRIKDRPRDDQVEAFSGFDFVNDMFSMTMHMGVNWKGDEYGFFCVRFAPNSDEVVEAWCSYT